MEMRWPAAILLHVPDAREFLPARNDLPHPKISQRVASQMPIQREKFLLLAVLSGFLVAAVAKRMTQYDYRSVVEPCRIVRKRMHRALQRRVHRRTRRRKHVDAQVNRSPLISRSVTRSRGPPKQR